MLQQLSFLFAFLFLSHLILPPFLLQSPSSKIPHHSIFQPSYPCFLTGCTSFPSFMASFYLIPGLVQLPMCCKPTSLLFSIPSGCTSFCSLVASFSHTLALGPFLKFSMGCYVLYFSLTSVCAVPSP